MIVLSDFYLSQMKIERGEKKEEKKKGGSVIKDNRAEMQ